MFDLLQDRADDGLGGGGVGVLVLVVVIRNFAKILPSPGFATETSVTSQMKIRALYHWARKFC